MAKIQNLRELVKLWLAHAKKQGITDPTTEDLMEFLEAAGYDEDVILRSFKDNGLYAGGHAPLGPDDDDVDDEEEPVVGQRSMGDLDPDEEEFYKEVTTLVKKLTPRRRELLYKELSDGR